LAASKPFVALTLGDPGGIGPWVSAAAALDPGVRRRCRPVLVGDAGVLRRHVRPAARVFQVPSLEDYQDRPKVLNVFHLPHPRMKDLRLGEPSRLSGEAAQTAIRAAVALALRKQVAAVVTGPLSKESLKMSGSPFPGHTELLQSLSGARRVEMLMAAGDLRGLLITRHIPLKEVPARLSAGEITAAVRLTDAFLRRRLGRRPRWAVCGLNPHAGDNGLLGGEEKRVVAPAVRRLRALGVAVQGPLPADVAWARHAEGLYDACACLYHDQGMIPLKTLHPKRLVNITVGLPFVRTSPGHGTAFDLARGRPPFAAADPSATVEAVHQALDAVGKTAHN
jgi:4-hydroxythreonine-4-phosphate dehydrogenase